MIDLLARLTSLVNPVVLRRLTRRVVSSSSRDCPYNAARPGTAWPTVASRSKLADQAHRNAWSALVAAYLQDSDREDRAECGDRPLVQRASRSEFCGSFLSLCVCFL